MTPQTALNSALLHDNAVPLLCTSHGQYEPWSPATPTVQSWFNSILFSPSRAAEGSITRSENLQCWLCEGHCARMV
jgi:hypothetical protein